MKHLFTLLLSLCALGASAQQGNYLTFRQNSGNETSLSLEGLKITFSNGQLVATNGTQQATFALSDMSKMYFSATPTLISQATGSEEHCEARIEGGRLHVTAPEGASVSVYAADGRLMPHEGLQRGAYLVRIGQKVLKVMAR